MTVQTIYDRKKITERMWPFKETIKINKLSSLLVLGKKQDKNQIIDINFCHNILKVLKGNGRWSLSVQAIRKK